MLDLEDRFTAPMARAAAAAALLNRELNSLSGRSVQTSRATQNIDRDVSSLGRSSESAGRQIDRLSGRMRILGEVAAALGPGLIPIGAVGIPAIMGLTTQLGFAAVAGGTAVLAFNGVGDALKALNTYQLEPTGEHLQKLHETMQQLGPAARDFVRELDSLGGIGSGLRSTASAGLFPGLTEGIEAIVDRAPQLQRVVATVARTLGDLSAEAGKALAGPEWDGFFSMLENEAKPVLTDMGHALGSVVHGFAALTQAFLPLSNDFGAGLARMAAGFDRWASGLAQTEGFQNFVDYIRENGPKVLDLLGSLTNALVQIVQAAAPIGGPVLQALTGFLNALAKLADSDIGTPLFAAVAALSAYNRALAISSSLQGKVSTQVARTGASYRTLAADLAAVRTAGLSASRVQAGFIGPLTRAQTAAKNLTGRMRELGKTAGVVAGVGLVASGAADNIGLTNTATLALAGSLAGAPGAAIGAGAGLFLDMRDAGKEVAGAIDQANRALAATGTYASQIDQTTAAVARLNKEAKDLAHHGGLGDSFSDFAADVAGGDLTTKVKNAVKFLPGGLSALSGLIPGGETGTDKINKSLAETKKHLAELKYEAGQAFSAGASSAEKFADAMGAVSAKTIAARTAAHNTAVQFVGLGDSLNDSKVSLDGWINQMAASARALTEFGNNARKAADKGLRAGLIKALQEAGPEGAMRMAQLADATDAEIRKANRAWGAGQKAVRKYTDTVGGVPTHVSTDFELRGLSAAERALVRINEAIRNIPRRWSTTYYVNQVGGLNKAGQNFDPQHGSALGGPVPKDGGPYADRFPYLLAPGEYVVSNRAGQADRYRPLLDLMNAGRLAGGGPVPQIGTAVSSGGLPMIGTAVSATFGLAQAIRELRHFLDSHEKLSKAERARLEKKLDRLIGLQDALKGFTAGSLLPQKDPTNPIWAGIRASLAEVQKAFHAAGGTWTRALQQQKKGLLSSALELDRLTRKADALSSAYDDQKQATAELQRQMADFGQQVASNFRTSLFGGDQPASVRSILDTLGSDTARASSFYDAFNALSDKGLDKSVLQELGSTGDLASAQNLAATATSADIATINAAVKLQQDRLGLLAQSAASGVLGGQLALQQAAEAAAAAAVKANSVTMSQVEAAIRDGLAGIRGDVRLDSGELVGKVTYTSTAKHAQKKDRRRGNSGIPAGKK